MSEVTTIGLDLAKHVFQVHGVDAAGECVLRKQLRRGQVVAFFAPPPATPGCCGGLGEQDGVHRLGGDAPRAELSASGRGSINRRRTELARGQESVMVQSVDLTQSRAWRLIGTAIPLE